MTLGKNMPAAPKPLPADTDFVSHVNAILTCALTGINQYFLHARMLKHKGFMRLADYEYKASLDTMKHTDQLVNLVLARGGVPNMQDLGKLRVGEAAPEMLKNDLALAEETHAALQKALAQEENAILRAMAVSEEKHREFLRSQLAVIDRDGINAYLQTQV